MSSIIPGMLNVSTSFIDTNYAILLEVEAYHLNPNSYSEDQFINGIARLNDAIIFSYQPLLALKAQCDKWSKFINRASFSVDNRYFAYAEKATSFGSSLCSSLSWKFLSTEIILSYYNFI